MSLTLLHTARSFPLLQYEDMKNAVLGKQYNLTLIFVGEKRAQALNKAHRNASYIPNVLSFPLDEHNGEIYIAPSVAKRECGKFDLSPEGYIGFLFIHGLLHLKGLDHSDEMDTAEKRFMRRFKIQ
jgi:probable rRNA maturation factor